MAFYQKERALARFQNWTMLLALAKIYSSLADFADNADLFALFYTQESVKIHAICGNKI